MAQNCCLHAEAELLSRFDEEFFCHQGKINITWQKNSLRGGFSKGHTWHDCLAAI